MEAFQKEEEDAKEAAGRTFSWGGGRTLASLYPLPNLTLNLSHPFMLHDHGVLFFWAWTSKNVSSPLSSGSPLRAFNLDIQIIHPWIRQTISVLSQFPLPEPSGTSFDIVLSASVHFVIPFLSLRVRFLLHQEANEHSRHRK